MQLRPSTLALALLAGPSLPALAQSSGLPMSERRPVTYAFGAIDGERLGSSVANAGDWDGDGIDDLVVGSPEVGFDNILGVFDSHGAVTVVSGATGELIARSAFLFAESGTRLGNAVAGGFDFDDDGLPEVVTAAVSRGEVLVLERAGPTQATLQRVATLDTQDSSLYTEQGFGQVLANVGDLTGDGRPELAVGAPDSTRLLGPGAPAAQAGSVRLFSGFGFFELVAWCLADEDARMGSAITSVSDLDGDGVRELAFGAPGEPTSIQGSQGSDGKVFVVDGDFPVGQPSVLVELTGPQFGDGFGAALADLGDLDGGGASELAIGSSRWVGPGDLSKWGRVSVVELEGGSELWSREGPGVETLSGTALAASDLDGDGRRELIALERTRANVDGPFTSLLYALALDGLTGAPIERFDAWAATYGESPLAGGLDLDGLPGEEFAVGVLELEDLAGGVVAYGTGSAPAPGTVWTVDGDPSAGADFRAPSHATLVATGRDTIEVATGSYGPVGVTEPLALLGRPGFFESVEIESLLVVDEAAAALARLVVEDLAVQGVAGRLSASGLSVSRTATIALCDDVALGECTFVPSLPGREALLVTDSTVQLHTCTLLGSDQTFPTAPGGSALVVEEGSDVSVFGSFLEAGDSGQDMFGVNPAVPAIEARGASFVEVRGNSLDALASGLNGGGIPGPDVVASSSSEVLLAPSLPPVVASGPVQTLPEARAWISYRVDPPVGGTLRIDAYAESGSPLALSLSLGTAELSLPGVVGEVRIDPGQVLQSFALSGLGLFTSSATFVPVPANPSLVGLDLHLQAFEATAGGAFVATNGGAVSLAP